ncbi:putative glutamine synthetase-like, partial [Capsicum annuum]
DGGQGESMICTKRMPHLAECWKSLETVIAAECQALTLQSLGNLKEAQELLESSEAENALRGCISAYKEFVTEKSLSDAPGVKAEYILCLKHLVDLLTVNKTSSKDRSSNAALQELKDEIKRVQVDLSKKGGRRS